MTRHLEATPNEASMAVGTEHRRASTKWRSELLFLVITLGPWIVLVWLLLWSRK